MVYTDEISEWSRHTAGGFELIEVDGDHWFLNRNHALITATLRDVSAGVALTAVRETADSPGAGPPFPPSRR